MENFLYLGVVFFTIDAIIIIANGLWISVRFGRYLEENYPKQYQTLIYDDYIKKVFRIPWDKNSMPYFVWRSADDLGDPRIAIFKKKIKWTFYSFFLNAIAAVIFFGAIAFLLDLSK